VESGRTTELVQRYLDQLAQLPGDAPAEPIVRELLAGSVSRLQILCASMLLRNYPRLTRPPLNLEAEEMLNAVVERMLKAMRSAKPGTVRQFFAMANRHMRWELNDMARRLDKEEAAVELRDSMIAAPSGSSASQISLTARRILDAIEGLPDEEREAFNLIRVQGITVSEAAEAMGVSSRTVQRRVNRARILLTESLSDLQPLQTPSKSPGDPGRGV
jgi:RNA polymerase sigma-70 factor (ECF subfamily)